MNINFECKILTNISMIQYLFVVRFKSYIPINENFVALVTYMSVGIWSLLYGITFMIIPGKLGINYYMCTGEDPRSDYYSTKKVSKVPILHLIRQDKNFLLLEVSHQCNVANGFLAHLHWIIR